MQDALASPGIQVLIGFLFGAGGLAAFYKLFLERKKPKADIHESEARARLSDADANSKDVDSSIKAAEIILSSARRMAEQEREIARPQNEVERLLEANRIMDVEMRRLKHGGNGKGH